MFIKNLCVLSPVPPFEGTSEERGIFLGLLLSVYTQHCISQDHFKSWKINWLFWVHVENQKLRFQVNLPLFILSFLSSLFPFFHCWIIYPEEPVTNGRVFSWCFYSQEKWNSMDYIAIVSWIFHLILPTSNFLFKSPSFTIRLYSYSWYWWRMFLWPSARSAHIYPSAYKKENRVDLEGFLNWEDAVSSS